MDTQVPTFKYCSYIKNSIQLYDSLRPLLLKWPMAEAAMTELADWAGRT
jgi:hypothetical protein